MHLTLEVLERFIDGQLEIQNPKEGLVKRGEIESVTVYREDCFRVTFKWLAQMGDDSLWHAHDDRELVFPANEMLGNEVGDRVAFRILNTPENGIFFPPEERSLDPSKVEGLKLPA